LKATEAESLGAAPAVFLDPRLPAVKTDAERLRLALVNIVSNACHAVAARGTPSGDAAPITVRTRATRTGGVQITISDKGIGIAPEDLPNVFVPYFTTRRTGTGRSEEHTSELQSRENLVCRLLLE